MTVTRVRDFDWATTGLGPMEDWGPALRTTAALVLGSPLPMYVAWGDTGVQLYNDAFARLLGDQHPRALGGLPETTFADSWDRLGPVLRDARAGAAIELRDWPIGLDRHGAVEDCWFDLGCSAIPDERGGPGGVLMIVAETTARVLVDRRAAVTRALGARLGGLDHPRAIAEVAVAALADAPDDLPMVGLYAIDADSAQASRLAAAGPRLAHFAPPDDIALTDDSDWPALVEVARTGLTRTAGSPRGTVVAIATAGAGSAVLVVGLNPRLRCDDAYRGFLEQLAAIIGEALRRPAAPLGLTAPPREHLLATLEYELRNPLTPIAAALEIMRRRGDTLVGRERLVIERQLAHMIRLMDDLLDASRLAQGGIPLERQPVELATIVERALVAVRPRLDERAPALQVDVPRAGLLVEADPRRLAQAIGNLVANAIKYTDRGGRIAIRARRLDQRLALEIVDEGIGIAQDMTAAVLEPFVQELHAYGLAGTRGGLGLGLSIARAIIEQHGGELGLHSAGRGRGTEARVALPAARSVEGDGALILIVDDDRETADLLSVLMIDRGYRTLVAYDGPSALRAVEDARPVAALVDLGMPEMTGFEVGIALRQRPGLEQLHLVAITGLARDVDRERARTAGFRTHLVKPIGPELTEAIVAALRSKDSDP